MLHDINDIMFRPEDVRPRTGLLSDEEDERMDEFLRSRGLRTRDEARRFLDADKGWMVKIMHSWSYTVPHFDQTRERIGSAPWHGENPAECNMTTSLSVCCKLTNYHKGSYPGPNYYQGPTYPLWLMAWAKSTSQQPIDELMRDGRVFSDGSHQVWVQLTETEFKDSFSGESRGKAIYEYMTKDLLKRVDPGTPQHMQHMSGMMPFNEYRPCTVTEDVTEDADDAGADKFYIEEADGADGADGADDEMSDGADDEMSDGAHGAGGGTRAQKKHKPKHKHKTKTKTKTKSKCKTTKTKSKCKRKTKPKSKTKTKTKTKNRNH